MRDKKNNRNKWLHLRLTDDELQLLTKAFTGTTERKLSDYSRKILLGKPMIKGYRNLSSDALIQEFSLLIKTLNGIANNYNQAVHKLHTLRQHHEFKTWFVTHEMDKRKLLQDVQYIKDFINKNASIWLQS